MKDQHIKRNFYRAALCSALCIAISGALTGIAFAQDADNTNSSNGGWRRFDPTQANGSGGGPSDAADPGGQAGPQAAPSAPPPASVPSQIVIPAGTWVTVRVNEPISSKHNHTGDSYSATLAEPLVADGYVIARRGQSIAGRVAESDQGGHAKGRLGLELTDLTFVDGQQVAVKTELSRYEAAPSRGREAAAIVGTTGIGAAIGAAAAGGIGAAAGAGAGALVSTGVLAAHGRETVVLPEDRLTFRTTAPITVSTDRAPQAFLPVQQSDYDQRPVLQRRVGPPPPYGYPYAYGPYPYGYPYYYGPGYYYGPFVGFGFYGRFGGRW